MNAMPLPAPQWMNYEEAKQVLGNHHPAPYEILGIPKHATGKEIFTAYKQKRQQFYHDTDRLRVVVAAYVILTSD